MTDYGSDFSCVNDLSGDGRVISGPTVVAEAIARRLLTPRGRLIADPNYGFDLSQYVNDDTSERDLAGLRAAIVAECLKDERVEAVEVEVVLDSVGVLTVTIALTLATDKVSLTLAVTDVSVTLVRVE